MDAIPLAHAGIIFSSTGSFRIPLVGKAKYNSKIVPKANGKTKPKEAKKKPHREV